jgi:hypothetical protein
LSRNLTLSLLSTPLLLLGSCAEPASTTSADLQEQVATAEGEPGRFSFFLTSFRALQELSGSQHGFGGDLRFGETGENAGLRGADKICATIAEASMPGTGKKGWRAFLSATKGGPGSGPVHAIDRVGAGPWYDRLGRLVARDKTDLPQMRPRNADPQIINDLPNEDGVPNRRPDGQAVDNHHVLTGSDERGQLYRSDPHATCNDWTKSARDVADAPRVGLSWPRAMAFGGAGGGPRPGGGRPGGGGTFPFPTSRDGGVAFPFPTLPDGGVPDFLSGPAASHWISAMNESGCAPGASIVNAILPDESNPTVGSGGGYGGFYCFALQP